MLVDGDLSQGFRVLDHFLGGELAIAYVQPSSGNALSAAQIANQLTPLPQSLVGQGGGAFAQTLSVSVQRSSTIEVSPGTTPEEAADAPQVKVSPRAAVLTQAQVFEALAGHGTPLATPQPWRGGGLQAYIPGGYVDAWSAVDEWDSNIWRAPVGQSKRPGRFVARRDDLGRGEVARARAYSPELDQLITAMAGFRGLEVEGVGLSPIDRYQQHPQLATAVV